MTVVGVLLWILAILATLGTAALAVVAVRLRRPLLALPATVPVAVGIVLAAAGARIDPGTRALPVLLAFALAAVGVIAGSPLATAVLDRTARPEAAGEHGGILVRREGAVNGPPREIMRGGSVIGYLERAAVVGAIAIGHPEVLAAVIAVKGLGRFSELDTSEARERFIIGTLVSLIWSSTCGALIWLQVL